MDHIQFTERMAGNFHKLATEKIPSLWNRQQFNEALQSQNSDCEFTVTVAIDDLDKFLLDPQLEGVITGKLKSPFTHQDLTIQSGTFNLFTTPQMSPDFNTAKEMHYCLYVTEKDGRAWTFCGFKEVLKEDALNAWKETTTLYFYIWNGHSPFTNIDQKEVLGTGILHISALDFAHQLTTFKTNSSTNTSKIEVMSKFIKAFSENLWEAYAPFIFTTTSDRWNEHIIPLQSEIGVPPHLKKQFYRIHTADGLNLELNRFVSSPQKNVVLLLHGLTTSTDMFIMPEHKNLVTFLSENNFTDIWSFDWRGSGRLTHNLAPHRYTIDDIASFDIPAAINQIKSTCGEDVKIHVICHCVGSLSFMCSLSSGNTSNIASVISNSVSLTPKVRWQSKLKLMFGPFFLEYIFRYPYLSPKIPYMPGPVRGKWIYWMERSIRHECKEPACHMVSFMWGWGFPAAYEHKNLNVVTHRRLADLFGGTSFHYYRHILKMVRASAAVSMKKMLSPINYLQKAQMNSLPPILLMSGDKNNIFPNSNKTTYEALKSKGKNVQYFEVTGYGHQDVFMGQNCHIDVFPKLLQFLNENK